MQISITNGTLTQISETLQASSGYTLPTTISVSGATSNYNSTTGAITLTNLTQTMSITASGESQATGISNIFFGNSQMASAYYGNSEIASIWYGNTKVYEKGGASSGYNVDIYLDTNAGRTAYVKKDGIATASDNDLTIPMGTAMYSTYTLTGVNSYITILNASGDDIFIYPQDAYATVSGDGTSLATVTFTGNSTINLHISD